MPKYWGRKKKMRERSSTCSQATRDTAKGVEEKSSVYFITEGIGALWGVMTWQNN